jgi:hypothetical protein
MPKFSVEWEITIEIVVEAESLEAAEEAARQHVTGPLHEWADLRSAEDWRTNVAPLQPACADAADMGVIKNAADEWEAVNINDARRHWHDATIKGYAQVQCPKCGEVGRGQDFFVGMGSYQPGRIECPQCHTYCIGPPPGSFIVDAGPAEPLPGDQFLPGIEE